MRGEERAERLVSRIESFSDLVIGFSLALLALTLSIPSHIVDLITNPWWLVAYFWTFAVICALWFNHQRLFTHYFVPEIASILLNFLFLAMVGLIVYFVQVFVHYHDEYEKMWSFLAYFFVFGVAFISIGTLYLHGTKRRSDQLEAKDRFDGIYHGCRALAVGIAVIVGGVVTVLLKPVDMSSVWPVAVFAAIGNVGVRVVLRSVKERLLGAIDA